MTSIALIGPGAVGATVAAWLAQSPDHDITLCVRTPFDRLHVETPEGEIVATPRIIAAPAEAEPVDWVLVATKAYDVEGTARWLVPLVGPRTRVAILQNGVEHVARFEAYVPADRLVPVVVDIPAERVAPGHVRQRRNGTLLAPDDANGAGFAALFRHTPIEASTTADFATAAWRKLALNCAGAVNALTLKPAGVAQRDDIADVMRALVRECIAVGRAEGAQLDDGLPDAVVEGYRASPADSVNSLHGDRAAGRPMELDARNGVIVRLGAKHGIETPANAMVVALLAAAAS